MGYSFVDACLFVEIERFIRVTCVAFVTSDTRLHYKIISYPACFAILVMLSTCIFSFCCMCEFVLVACSMWMLRNATYSGQSWFAGTVFINTIDRNIVYSDMQWNKWTIFEIRSLFFFSLFLYVKFLNPSLILHCCFYTFLVIVNWNCHSFQLNRHDMVDNHSSVDITRSLFR